MESHPSPFPGSRPQSPTILPRRRSPSQSREAIMPNASTAATLGLAGRIALPPLSLSGATAPTGGSSATAFHPLSPSPVSPYHATILHHHRSDDDDMPDPGDAPPVLDLFARPHVVAAAPPIMQSLLRWHRITITLLIMVYTGFYFCRTNLSVALPTLLHATHLSKKNFGNVISSGYAFYAMGKIANGILIDRVGGRSILLLCLTGSVLCTVAFGSVSDDHASIQLFAFIWSLNRIFQSGGWPALTTLVRNWFPPMQHGKIMGVASLSYSLGDAIIRLFLGKLVSYGFTWQGIFFTSAVAGTLLMLPSFTYLHSAPEDLGLPCMTNPDPPSIPLQTPMTGAQSPTSRRKSFVHHFPDDHSSGPHPLLLPTHTSPAHSPTAVPRTPKSRASPRTCFGRQTILANPKYVILLLQSPLYTWIREIFNSWAVVYLHESYQLAEGTASILTLVFPLLAALSSVGGGFLIDHIQRVRRGRVYTSLVLATALTMAVLAVVAAGHDHNQQQQLAGGGGPAPQEGQPNHGKVPLVPASPSAVALVVMLMGLAALFSTAPASWAEGIFPLELATGDNAGIVVASVHAAGYIGAILAGKFAGAVVEANGWGRLFAMMSGAATVNAALAGVYWWVDWEGVKELEMEQDVRGSKKGKGSRVAPAGGKGYKRVAGDDQDGGADDNLVATSSPTYAGGAAGSSSGSSAWSTAGGGGSRGVR